MLVLFGINDLPCSGACFVAAAAAAAACLFVATIEAAMKIAAAVLFVSNDDIGISIDKYRCYDKLDLQTFV